MYQYIREGKNLQSYYIYCASGLLTFSTSLMAESFLTQIVSYDLLFIDVSVCARDVKDARPISCAISKRLVINTTQAPSGGSHLNYSIKYFFSRLKKTVRKPPFVHQSFTKDVVTGKIEHNAMDWNFFRRTILIYFRDPHLLYLKNKQKCVNCFCLFGLGTLSCWINKIHIFLFFCAKVPIL